MCALRSFVLALALAVGVISPVLAQAPAAGDGRTPDTAISLLADQAQSGNFVGQPQGAFAYYWFDQPGDGRTGMLTLGFTPNDPITAGVLGINTWQGNVSLGSIKGTESGTRGQTTLSFFSNKAGRVLVQLFNYASGKDVSYTLTLTGVPTAAGASAAPSTRETATVPSTAGASPDSPAPLLAAGASGSLQGNGGGAYSYYTFPHPGDGSTGMLTVTFGPVDVSNGFGVSVWQGNVRLGAITGSGGTPGSNTLSFFSNRAGPLLLKVENYLPGRVVNYTVSVSGIPLS